MLKLPDDIDAILFDWDGTLADSVPLVTQATNEVLAAHGYPAVTEAQIHDGMRFPTTERMLHHLGRPVDDEDYRAVAAAMADEFYAASDRLGSLCVRLFPGVREMVEEIERAGVPMGIVTNNRATAVRTLLDGLRLGRTLGLIVAEEDVSRPKPDPEGVLRALEALGARAGHTLFVGDSLTDARAAERAGVIGVGAAWPQASIVHGDGNLYEHVCARPDDLVDALRAAEVIR